MINDNTLPFFIFACRSNVYFTEIGKFQIRALMCSGLSLFAVLVETSAVSYLLPAAECELDLSLKEKGMLGSAVFIGKIFPNVNQLSDLTNGYAKRVC